MNIKRKVLSVSLSSMMALGAVTAVSLPVGAVGNGPGAGNGAVQTSILHTYESLVDYITLRPRMPNRMRCSLK